MADTDGTVGASRSLATAAEIANDVFLPAAPEVDAADRIPESHFALLTEKGFYGFAAPDDLTTMDLTSFAAACRAVETLASGCMTTTFVWTQHHGAVSAAARTTNTALRDAYLGPLVRGELRAGIAVTAAIRPGAPMLRAEPTDGGWVFDGVAPWVSGWGMVDSLLLAARDTDDEVVTALVDANDGDGDTVRATPPARLVAAQASRTVTLHFTRYFVPHERVAQTMPRATYVRGDPESVRFNGNLALGVAARAIALMGDDGATLAAQLDSVRERLLTATHEEVPAARAATSHLASRASAALTTQMGGRSLLADSHAQRLAREATFLLAFGTRPAVRTALLRGLTAPPATG